MGVCGYTADFIVLGYKISIVLMLILKLQKGM